MFIFQTNVNCFHYLYQDAETFHEQAKTAKGFDQTRYSRTAMLLYIISLEALANRAINEFVDEPKRSFFLRKEDKFNLEDKYFILPILINENSTSSFNTGVYPWTHFRELVRIRNDFLHPKHNRLAFYEAEASHIWTPLDWKNIPSDSNINENQIIYRQTQIPKDPYAIRPEHLEIVKKIVDDFIFELSKLLSGKITQKWLDEDKMDLCFPEGATINDIPEK